MSFKLGKTEVTVGFGFVLVVAVFLLFDRTGIASWALLFSAAHEAGHLAAMAFFRSPPQKLDLNFYGMRITTAAVLLDYRREILILLVGPATNLALALVFWAVRAPVPAAVNIAVAFFNLLPVVPLDGGRLIQTLLSLRSPDRAATLARILSLLVVIPLFWVGIWLFLGGRIGFTFLLFLFYVTAVIVTRPNL